MKGLIKHYVQPTLLPKTVTRLYMSDRAEILREAFQFAFEALDRTLQDLTQDEYTIRLTPASNNIQSILNHISRITNLNMMRIILGDFDYTPAGWRSDYVEQEYTSEQLIHDLHAGRDRVLARIAELSDEDLEEVLPMMSGPYPRKIGLYAYLGEIFHHRGQIAFIRGTLKRLREKNPNF